MNAGKVLIAVRLKTPDPTAATALSTLQRTMRQECPVLLDRYDLWEFSVTAGREDSVQEIVDRCTDIVNPNKQKYIILGNTDVLIPGEDTELVWVGVVISDHDNSVSENWSSLLKRRGFPVEAVRFETLWRLAWPSGTPYWLAREMAMAVSTSVTRESGLLGNPVFQRVMLQKG